MGAYAYEGASEFDLSDASRNSIDTTDHKLFVCIAYFERESPFAVARLLSEFIHQKINEAAYFFR